MCVCVQPVVRDYKFYLAARIYWLIPRRLFSFFWSNRAILACYGIYELVSGITFNMGLPASHSTSKNSGNVVIIPFKDL